ncbi:MAG TPA: hypothetical protein VFI43_07020 [Nitrosospira sp.]|nr:hypothetical protein [Nitrosospira sp.]
MEKSHTMPSHHRLKELLAIPERKRTDAEWAEINELEITLTPINRAAAHEQTPRRREASSPAPPKSRDTAHLKQALKKPRKRPPRGGSGA